MTSVCLDDKCVLVHVISENGLAYAAASERRDAGEEKKKPTPQGVGLMSEPSIQDTYFPQCNWEKRSRAKLAFYFANALISPFVFGLPHPVAKS